MATFLELPPTNAISSSIYYFTLSELSSIFFNGEIPIFNYLSTSVKSYQDFIYLGPPGNGEYYVSAYIKTTFAF